MATPFHSEFRRIAWNRVAIILPSAWQAKVTALQHLNFENNSKAIMEIRWQNCPASDVQNFTETLTRQYHELSGEKLTSTIIPRNCKELFQHFEVTCFAKTDRSMPVLTFLYAPEVSLFIMMRFYDKKAMEHPLFDIRSIDYSKENDTFFHWSIQDFQVQIPLTYHLSKYTMKAGLTVLQFHRGKTVLNICRLALAEKRLEEQNLEEIFYSLLGEQKRLKAARISRTAIRYKNTPGLLQQLGLRFQRKNPFRLAALWRDQENDRLLGVYMEDIKPLDQEDFEMICAHYEIPKA
jgi:hypothetical protein